MFPHLSTLHIWTYLELSRYGCQAGTGHVRVAALDAKCRIMVIVCPTTRLINMQVHERGLADAIISGVTRLSCEIGVPKNLFIDQAKVIKFGLENLEFNNRREGTAAQA